MIFYFERATGKRVSEATWKRSKAQGGSRFVRRSGEPRQPKNPVKPEAPIQGDNTGSSAPAPSQNPRSFEEWQNQSRKKFKKKADQDFFDYDDGREYETGVDY